MISKYFPMVMIGGFIAGISFIIFIFNFVRYSDPYYNKSKIKKIIITVICLIIGLAILIPGIILHTKETEDDFLKKSEDRRLALKIGG